VYVSDIRKIGRELAWRPETSFEEGLERLIGWAKENASLFRK